MKPLFSPEELAEMEAADAEIEATFRLTNEDIRRSREAAGQKIGRCWIDEEVGKIRSPCST